MKTKFTNLHNLEQYFADENTCVEYLEVQRWIEPACLRCGGLNPYVIKAKRKGYKCRDCGYKFNVLTGTIFENSKLPLIIWFKAIYIATSHKKGISSLQLGKDLGITQKTAWFVLSRIRELLKEKAPVMLENTVEIDETFVGGKFANRPQSFKARYNKTAGRSESNKTVVFGLLQRDGKVVNKVVKNTTKDELFPVIEKHVAKGSRMVTDEWKSYVRLPELGYTHESVRHNIGEYVNGDVHTNGIEGYWSNLKRGIIGIYHQVSPKHLHRYCDEFSFRYNTRKEKEADRFALAGAWPCPSA